MIGRATSVIASYIAVFLLELLGFRGFFIALAVIAIIPLGLLTVRGIPAETD
jgi:predicted RND superfamily exporter protein